MKFNVLLSLSLLLASSLASAVEFKYSGVSEAQKKVLETALADALKLTPDSFRSGLPKSVNIHVKSFGAATSIPDVCSTSTDKESLKGFVYGRYRNIDHSLTLNKVLVDELAKGASASKKISCQHKSLFAQAQATLIHELSHAWDMHNGSPSSTRDFRNVAGFFKFLTFTKRANKNPMRSADEYEFKNPEEAFAVNMEYFAMDEEYACRRPVMFKYFKELFNQDPYPGRTCKPSNTVMLATQIGLIPYTIDPERVYRVDYLLASSGSDIMSGFGHSMFRIVVCAPEHANPLTGKPVPATPVGPKCLEDRLFHVVGSYRANNEGSTLSYMKGIFGGYPSMLFMLGLGDVIEEYNHAELRDLVAYPLKFTPKEKKEFLARMLEEHWDYRGDYKFLTNNCAVESLRTIGPELKDHAQLGGGSIFPTLTPGAVLSHLENHGLIDRNDPGIETFHANISNLLTAFSLSYGGEKADKKTLTKFVTKSEPAKRREKFHLIASEVIPPEPKKKNLEDLKSQLVQIASFSVIEQQIIRTKAEELKKKLGEVSSDKKRLDAQPELKALLNSSQNKSVDIGIVSTDGYGIPQQNEIRYEFDAQKTVADSGKQFETAQRILTGLFPNEVHEMEELSADLKEMNTVGLEKRRAYRKLLDTYLQVKIEGLKTSDPAFLQSVLNGDYKSFRERLGRTLLTESEISDERIAKLIEGPK